MEYGALNIPPATSASTNAGTHNSSSRRRGLTTSADWLSYFERNARSLRPIPWELGVSLSHSDLATAASSVPTFQIGETGSGRRLLAAASHHAAISGDETYTAAMKLFIAEEQRHGSDLGRWLDLAGIPRIKRHWTNGIFRRVRQLAGLELMISLLLTAEVMAKVYYAALRKATCSLVLQRLCEQILKDEVAHIRFQSQRVALLRRSRSRPSLILAHALQRMLFLCTMLVVWRSHREVLQAGGLDFTCFFKKVRVEAEIALNQMDPGQYEFSDELVKIASPK